MVIKPAVRFFRTAGFLFMAVHLIGILACKIQDDQSNIPNGLPVTERSINEALRSDCYRYCSLVYDDATGCDETKLEVEHLGCEAICNVMVTAIQSQCESLFIDYYHCIDDESISFECESQEDSPQPTDLSCEDLVLDAETCAGLSTSL